jgi:glycyl-tRNA synthetase beta chain
MPGELLIEIGTEEIPAGYLRKGLEGFRERAEACLKAERIAFEEGLETFGTPRRLVLIGRGVADRQQEMVEKITGPPKKASYDAAGNPTEAALGFAKRHGVPVGELACMETPKGEYLCLMRRLPGRTTPEVLAEFLPKIIADIPWPKSMRWGSGGFSFVRPIHWVLALFDGTVISFDVAGVSSGNQTRGHRFMSGGWSAVKNLQDYLRIMQENFVIIDQAEREKEVEKCVLRAAEEVSGAPLLDQGLLSEVANMVEFPSAVCGSYDRAFLDLPESVLITSMKEHQRYFALRDGTGRLMAHFVAVNNTLARDESVVRKGHERVLRARLSDAAFFFQEDRKRPLLDRLEDLKKVIYQAELGTSYAKVQRFAGLAEYLAEKIAPDRIRDVRAAAELCKCDLVTEMVGEFPGLQGVMGSEYARLEGHPEEICRAIHEHYLPARAGEQLPASTLGAIVGLADRMDTVAGCFAIDQEPTGAADPFALRRHSLAVMRILEARQWDISLKEFLAKALSLLAKEIAFDEGLVGERVLNFFRERYKNMAVGSGYALELVEAVVSVNFDHIDRLPFRIEQLQRFIKESQEFELLVLTFKRVTNILKNQKGRLAVDPGLFKEPCESSLWQAYLATRDSIDDLIERKNYFESLTRLAQLRRPVDDLFEGVEIMTKDNPRLRENRVALLQNLAQLFLRHADFAKFSI